MKKFLFIAGLIFLSWWSAWQVAKTRIEAAPTITGEALDPAVLQHVAIAPRAEALTFARFLDPSPKLLLVTGYDNGEARGIDVQQALPGSSDDPVALFKAQGYAALESLRGPEITVAAERLLLPFAGTASQIAVGINYPAHGEEVAVQDSFLFPKQVAATPHTAGVPARDYLLDYEIELGFVLLEPLTRGAVPQHLGLVLASDYTDRAELMRHVNLLDVSSGDGFTQGKSQPGSMPLGNLLVIPRDYDTFYRALRLELWCNGQRRQLAEPAQMSWDLRRIIIESFAREPQRWQWNGAPVALPIANGVVPARTLILSGTPGGVIYVQPTPRQLFAGISEWFFGLHWSRPQHIVEPFVRDAYASGRYLKPGDEVVMRSDRLGVMRNRIVAE